MSSKNKIFKVLMCLLFSVSVFSQGSSIYGADEEVATFIIDDADVGSGLNQIEYHGIWVAGDNLPETNWHNGTEHWSNTNRWGNTLPSFEVKFKGSEIALYGQKADTLGIYKVQVDKLAIEEADAYSATKLHKQKLYEKKGLTEGEHTLKFYVQDKINAAGIAPIGTQLDYIEVGTTDTSIASNHVTTVNNNESGSDLFQFEFSDGWNYSSGSGGNYDKLFQKDDSWTELKGAIVNPYYNLRFYGSGVELYGVKEAIGCIADVYVDGVKHGEIDYYAPTWSAQNLQYKVEGLEEGEHVVKVVLDKRRNPASSATRYTGEIDFAKVTHKAIAVTDITFSSSSLQVEKGDEIRLSAQAVPSYATDPKFIYSSLDESIAVVDQNGKIDGVKTGKTKITVQESTSLVVREIEITVMPEGLPIEAFTGSADIHHMQDEYSNYLGSMNEHYEATAWKGDVLNSKVVVLTKNKPVDNLKVVASKFTSDSGAVIAENQVEITWLKEVEANMGRGQLGTAPNVMYPDVLYTSGPIDSVGKKVNSAWVNFNIPKDARPGIYTGTLKVSADGMDEVVELPYEFEVLDLDLPEVKDTNTQLELWQHPFVSARYYGLDESEWFKEEHIGYLKSIQKEYAETGGRGVVATVVEEAWNHQSYDGDPSMVTWTKKLDGTFEFDYKLFDKWIDLNIEVGVLDPEAGFGQIKCYSIVPWGNQITYFDEATQSIKKERPAPGTATWTTNWNAFLGDFIEHVDDKGWLDITYISMDERSINELEPAVDLIRSIKTDEGKGFKISSAMNFEAISDYDFLDKIDDISIGISHIKRDDAVKQLAEHRTQKGLLTTVYNCVGDAPNSNTISMPVESNWILWYSMNQHLSGYMRWSYDGWTENPLENTHYKYWEAGDPFFIYPGEKGTDVHFRSSPRFERLKDGMRDINKAKYLMTLTPEAKTEIQTLVDSLARPKEKVNPWGAMMLASEADKQLTISEVQRMKDTSNAVAREYIGTRIIPVESIQAEHPEWKVELGATTTINYEVKPNNASDKTVYFFSEDETVATVSPNGVVSGVNLGETKITLSSKEDVNDPVAIISEVKIVVVEKVIKIEDILLDIDNIDLKVGESYTVKAEIVPSNATSPKLYWWSSNDKVATVVDGKITAAAKGKVKISVSTLKPSARQQAITKEIQLNISEKAGVTPNETTKPSTLPNGATVKSGDASNFRFLMMMLLGSGYAFYKTIQKKKMRYENKE